MDAAQNPREGGIRMLSRCIFVFAALPSLFVTCPALAASAGPFDGKWSVRLVCPQAPDGALPFTFDFSGAVKGSVLHAVHGQSGQPPWLSLDGSIGPDGSAALTARGIAGTQGYNVNHAARGIPYRYPVSAHFEPSRGSGYWVSFRKCDFTFTKV